jgi:hypothetical protein
MLNKSDIGIVIRAVSVGIRFCLPILILAIAGQEELGRYYLYTSAIALIIFCSTFELNLYFAKTYVNNPSKEYIFQHFQGVLTTALILNAIFGCPALIGFLWWSGERDIDLYVTAFFYVSTEVVVNEYGRYLTNISKVKSVVYRDLYRAVSIVLAGVISLVLFQKVVSWMYFFIFGLLNATLLMFENYNAKREIRELTPSVGLHQHIQVTISTIRQTKGAVAQSSLVYLYPLIERIMLESTVGLAVLGGYAFLSSVIQASVSVIFLPAIARYRTLVLQLGTFRRESESSKIPGLACFILKTLCLGVLVVFGLHTLSMINIFQGKFSIDPWFSIIALVGVAANNLIYVVSPDFAKAGRVFTSTLVTSFIYVFSLLCAFLFFTFVAANHMLVGLILGLGFILQIAARQRYL